MPRETGKRTRCVGSAAKCSVCDTQRTTIAIRTVLAPPQGNQSTIFFVILFCECFASRLLFTCFFWFIKFLVFCGFFIKFLSFSWFCVVGAFLRVPPRTRACKWQSSGVRITIGNSTWPGESKRTPNIGQHVLELQIGGRPRVVKHTGRRFHVPYDHTDVDVEHRHSYITMPDIPQIPDKCARTIWSPGINTTLYTGGVLPENTQLTL